MAPCARHRTIRTHRCGRDLAVPSPRFRFFRAPRVWKFPAAWSSIRRRSDLPGSVGPRRCSLRTRDRLFGLPLLWLWTHPPVGWLWPVLGVALYFPATWDHCTGEWE